VASIEDADFSRPDAAAVALLGNSITNNNSVVDADFSGAGLGAMTAYSARGWWTWAAIELGHRCRLVGNFGVSGNTAQQIAARVPAVIAATPQGGTVIVMCAGRNSISANDGLAVLTTVIRDEIVYPLLAAGLRVVIGNETPRSGDTTGQLAVLFGLNALYRELSRQHGGIYLADVHAAATDGLTSAWSSAELTFDSAPALHPSEKGAQIMGHVVALVVAALVPPVDTLSRNNADPGNLYPNAILAGTGGTVASGTVTTGAAPTSITLDSAGGTGGPVVGSKVARTDGKPGEWYQLAFSALLAPYARVRHSANATTLTEGHSYYAEVEFEVDAGFNPTLLSLLTYVRSAGGVGVRSVSDLQAATGPAALLGIHSRYLAHPCTSCSGLSNGHWCTNGRKLHARLRRPDHGGDPLQRSCCGDPDSARSPVEHRCGQCEGDFRLRNWGRCVCDLICGSAGRGCRSWDHRSSNVHRRKYANGNHLGGNHSCN
jgi:lysophospholipase L1-like esterase